MGAKQEAPALGKPVPSFQSLNQHKRQKLGVAQQPPPLMGRAQEECNLQIAMVGTAPGAHVVTSEPSHGAALHANAVVNQVQPNGALAPLDNEQLLENGGHCTMGSQPLSEVTCPPPATHGVVDALVLS